MAIYHFEAKIITRGTGRSVVAAAAYASCSKIYNEYDGTMHDYIKKRGNIYSEIFLPPNAPAEWQDRAELWNAVEAAEKSKDSRLARELIVALPIELGIDEWKDILQKFITENCVDKGMCADVCIHDTDGHNPHAHILLTVRPLDEKGEWQAKTQKEYLCKRGDEEQGFTADEFKEAQTDGWEKQYQYFVGKKKVYMPPSQAEDLKCVSKYPKSTRYGRQNPICAEWNSEEQITKWRKVWEDVVNLELERKQLNERIDCRSFRERDIDEQPTIHEGVTARIIEKNGGISERCELNRRIRADNKLLREIKAAIKKLLETATHTVSSIANALEKLRGAMIHCRYVINFSAKWKTAKSKEVVTLKNNYDDYMAVTAELKAKINERKKWQDEKVKTSAIMVFKQRKLTQLINDLSEQIEELRTKKNTILTKLKTNDIKAVKTKISDIQKAVPIMEKHSTECAAKLDNAQKEYVALKEQAQKFDTEKLQDLRFEIRLQIENEIIADLQKIYSGSFSRDLFNSAKLETDKSIGETERYSIYKKLECNRNKIQNENNYKKQRHRDNKDIER
ncbi:MAG: MobQ family relaxase [bacterium]|nr:MobQ family relaxase [bacterium]